MLDRDDLKDETDYEGGCRHLVLLPRWDSVEDMGREDKITGYTCESCNSYFPLEQAEEIRRVNHAITL